MRLALAALVSLGILAARFKVSQHAPGELVTASITPPKPCLGMAVVWGDGTTSTSTDCATARHRYRIAGLYTVEATFITTQRQQALVLVR